MAKPNFGNFVTGLHKLFKAMPSDAFDDLEEVTDLWEDGDQFKNPSREEVKVGPAEASSGAGAEKMVKEYSDPALQMGMAQKYAEFSSMLGEHAKAIRAIAVQQKAITSVIAEAVKAARPEAPEAAAIKGEPLNEDTFLFKANGKINKAKSEIRKADMADENEHVERKSRLEKAADLLKSAKRLLSKAEEDDEDDDEMEKSMDAFRSVTARLKKAEEEEKKEEEKKEEEKKEEAAKAAAAAVKAEKGGEEEEDDETKKSAAPAVKAEDDEGTEREKKEDKEMDKSANLAVDPSVKSQIEMLQTTVAGLMDTVMNTSKHSVAPPVFIKSMQVDTLPQRINDAIDNETLSGEDAIRAQTLVMHVKAVQEGRMDAMIVQQEIERTSEAVKALFTPAKAA